MDAAYAGVAAICPELRWIHAGVAEFADSYATNPHKWLLTALDFDACYVADRGALTSALSVLPEYLRNSASESGLGCAGPEPLGRTCERLTTFCMTGSE